MAKTELGVSCVLVLRYIGAGFGVGQESRLDKLVGNPSAHHRKSNVNGYEFKKCHFLAAIIPVFDSVVEQVMYIN
jgi:hypothetical protein